MLKLILTFLLVVIVTTTTAHNQLYKACNQDRAKFCPSVHTPYSASTLFESPCFKDHENELSPACKKLMHEYRLNPNKKPNQPHRPHHNPNKPPSHAAHPTSNANGTPLWNACHADRTALCPKLKDPFTEDQLFEAPCFREHLSKVSPACKTMFKEWAKERILVSSLLITGSAMTVLAGGLSCLALLCCGVACCVRRRQYRRRAARLAKRKIQKTTATDPLVQEEAAEIPQEFPYPMYQFPTNPSAPYSFPYFQPGPGMYVQIPMHPMEQTDATTQ